MPAGDAVGAAAELFTEHHSLGQVLGTGSANGRYDRLSIDDMAAANLIGHTKSATVFRPAAGSSTLVLFSQPSLAFQTASYYGPFIQLTNFKGGEFNFDLAKPFLAVASALLVHTQKGSETRLSFRDQFTPQWDKFFDKHMPSQVKRVGKPDLGWDPFPASEGSLNPNSIYLKISQHLSIDFSAFWANYAASIQYWLILFPKKGKLTGGVARWSYWVESGLLTQVVAEILRPNVILGAQSLTKALQDELAQFPAKNVYYLPGKQAHLNVSAGKNAVFKGNTLDDVTIVVG